MPGVHRMPKFFAAPLIRGLTCLPLVLLLSACPSKDKESHAEAGQIAAQVNESEISIHQVQTMMQLQPALSNQLGEAAAPRILDNLIEQELAAQGARVAGLDSNPKVLQAMELAKREVLARAYQDQLAAKAAMPDADAISSYFEAHPELFAKRRRYTLLETQVKVPADQMAPLTAKIEAAPSLEAIKALINQSGLPHGSSTATQWAEGLSMNMLTKLVALKNGQSMTVQAKDGLVIVSVLAAEDGPLTLPQARAVIQSALYATSRREAVTQGMEALRQQAKIKRMGAFAASAPASGEAPAASAAAAASSADAATSAP
jgi:EpsD family peptidyl-prolyl cis-trans isomerase